MLGWRPLEADILVMQDTHVEVLHLVWEPGGMLGGMFGWGILGFV